MKTFINNYSVWYFVSRFYLFHLSRSFLVLFCFFMLSLLSFSFLYSSLTLIFHCVFVGALAEAFAISVLISTMVQCFTETHRMSWKLAVWPRKYVFPPGFFVLTQPRVSRTHKQTHIHTKNCASANTHTHTHIRSTAFAQYMWCSGTCSLFLLIASGWFTVCSANRQQQQC